MDKNKLVLYVLRLYEDSHNSKEEGDLVPSLLSLINVIKFIEMISTWPEGTYGGVTVNGEIFLVWRCGYREYQIYFELDGKVRQHTRTLPASEDSVQWIKI